MTLQDAPMRYVSCPTAVINAPVDVVWALLIEPAAWGGVFDVRVGSIDPPGTPDSEILQIQNLGKSSLALLPAIIGQKISGETGLRILHLKLTFRTIEIDPHQHRLCLDVHLPFGITVHEDLSCTPLDVDHCRVDYRCNFDFPRGWQGSLAKVLIYHGFDSGPKDSLSRLKHAAERDAARGSGELWYED
jgi:Polyketide cyclase / dehydrase and lipid transport